VVKHGNRSVSSKSGSADVLEQLGLKLPLDEAAAGACLAATKFTFLFAASLPPGHEGGGAHPPGHGRTHGVQHPRAAHQPRAPKFQLTGAFNLPTAQLMAEALSGLPIERALRRPRCGRLG
jgi:anthranilate phosphoribosyltransferase